MSESSLKQMAIHRLGDYFQDCQKLDAETFAQQHGEAFLLHHGPITKMKLAVDSAGKFSQGPKTAPFGQARNAAASESITTTGSGRPFHPQADFLVFSVRGLAAGQAEDEPVWLGRSEGNDVVIPGATISAVHAFIKKDKKGDFLLQDMNSMNGSFVNSEPVPAQGMGPAVKLEEGDRVRLGSVKMTFLRAANFRTLVLKLLG